MIVIAVALVLIAAACAAVLMDATRSMLPAVGQPIPLRQVAPEVPVQRNREVSPDAVDDAHRAYGFVAALPAEPRTTLRASL
jgi:hypothetical protein